MTKRLVRMPSADSPLLDIVSRARRGPQASRGITGSQMEQIRRTVRRVPEVMVKVTGGGRKRSAVAEHLSYISHDGELDLETDDGQRVPRSGRKDLLRDWHLELSSGQYRSPSRSAKGAVRGIKLVHNIVLSMPAPTPPGKVLAAARAFAREKFALNHRYVMALHTHQQHPHVHLVVKAEGRDGRRLHIDKAMLREWREDFARMMREQGIAANATPRSVRGRSKATEREARYRTRKRGTSTAFRERFQSVKRELIDTTTIRDPGHAKLAATRKAVVAGWMAVAEMLEKQDQQLLAEQVRQFVREMPPVMTDREQLAARMIQLAKEKGARTKEDDRVKERRIERTR